MMYKNIWNQYCAMLGYRVVYNSQLLVELGMPRNTFFALFEVDAVCKWNFLHFELVSRIFGSKYDKNIHPYIQHTFTALISILLAN